MNTTSPASLDPAALSAFAAALGGLPKDEIQKAKRLYVRNAIADFEASRSTGRAFLVVFGVLSIIPIFLIVFIPMLIAYRSGVRAARQKILNALEVWRDELGSDYSLLREQIAAA